MYMLYIIVFDAETQKRPSFDVSYLVKGHVS